MARTTTYLNFNGDTEAAFAFYRAVFGTDYERPIARMGDAPPMPGAPPLSAEDARKVMHVALPILGGHVLMGTDALPSRGHSVTFGTNVTLNLEPDTRAEGERLFAALAEGGEVATPLTDMFWGSAFGVLVDRFGLRWMMNCPVK